MRLPNWPNRDQQTDITIYLRRYVQGMKYVQPSNSRRKKSRRLKRCGHFRPGFPAFRKLCCGSRSSDLSRPITVSIPKNVNPVFIAGNGLPVACVVNLAGRRRARLADYCGFLKNIFKNRASENLYILRHVFILKASVTRAQTLPRLTFLD